MVWPMEEVIFQIPKCSSIIQVIYFNVLVTIIQLSHLSREHCGVVGGNTGHPPLWSLVQITAQHEEARMARASSSPSVFGSES